MNDRRAAGADAVVVEWSRRVIAEYASAVRAQQTAWWLTRTGSPRELITDALDVARDELDHAQRSIEVVASRGGEAPIVASDALTPWPEIPDLVRALARHVVEEYCVAETVAVRLFRAMRNEATDPLVIATLDAINRDEPRHAALGWTTVDWLLEQHREVVRPTITEAAQRAVEVTRARYCGAVPQPHLVELDEDARACGLLSLDEYRAVVEHAIDEDLMPRFERRAVTLADR